MLGECTCDKRQDSSDSENDDYERYCYQYCGGYYDLYASDFYSYDDDYHDPDHDRYHSDFECTCYDVTEILRKHTVKLQLAGFYVSEKNIRLSKGISYWDGFSKECKAEIEMLMDEPVRNSVTFHDILTESMSKLVMYAGNEHMVQTLLSHDCQGVFPIYGGMITRRFRKAVERNKLLEEANSYFLQSFCQLSFYCVDQIFSFLSTRDLKVLVEAYKFSPVMMPMLVL